MVDSELVMIIRSSDPAVRNRALDAFCRENSTERLITECSILEQFRHSSGNLYRRHSRGGNGLGPVAPLEKRGSYG